jgi:hypothetical protein
MHLQQLRPPTKPCHHISLKRMCRLSTTALTLYSATKPPLKRSVALWTALSRILFEIS